MNKRFQEMSHFGIYIYQSLCDETRRKLALRLGGPDAWPNACYFIKNALYSLPETTSKSPVAWSYLSLSSFHVLSDPFDAPSYGFG